MFGCKISLRVGCEMLRNKPYVVAKKALFCCGISLILLRNSVRPHNISAELCPYLGSLPNLQCSLATSMHAKRVFIWLPIQLLTTFLFLLVDEMLPLKDLEVRPQLSLTDVYCNAQQTIIAQWELFGS